jgi:hypothetical protein
VRNSPDRAEFSVPFRGLAVVALIYLASQWALYFLVKALVSASVIEAFYLAFVLRMALYGSLVGLLLVAAGTTVRLRVTAAGVSQRFLIWWTAPTELPNGTQVSAGRATTPVEKALLWLLGAQPPISLRGPDGSECDDIPSLFVCDLSEGEYLSLLVQLQALIESGPTDA